MTTKMITANDDHGNEAGVSFKFYGTISGWDAFVSTHFVHLYWEPYGEYAEGELDYQIYVDGEIFQTITSNTQLITELEPSTTYSLTVIAYYEGAMIAFGDYEASTIDQLGSNEVVESDQKIFSTDMLATLSRINGSMPLHSHICYKS